MEALKNTIIGLFIASVALSLMIDPSVVLRYRLSIAVQTPEGIRSGSSVLEARYDNREGPRLWLNLSEVGRSYRTTGEAVFVDLGTGADGKPIHVIALLAGGDRGNFVDWHRYMPWAPFRVAGNANAYKDGAELKGMAEIPVGPSFDGGSDKFSLMPVLVTFPDMADPASAKIIYGTRYESRCREDRKPSCVPESTAFPIDEFATTFGSGYAFHKATVEILVNGHWPFNAYTSLAPAWMPEWLKGTPITTGIEGKLPGLKDIDAWNKLARKKQSPDEPYGGGSGALIRNW